MEDREEYALSEEMSLNEAVAKEEYKFPILLHTCGNKHLDSRPDYEDQTLPLDTLMLIERHAVVQCAHMKVLQVANEEDIISDKGAEFAVEYGGFVDHEMLIPITYPGTVKIIHPPKRRSRYAEVSQIIDDLPRFVRVELDTKTTPPADNYSVRTVKKGTILEITNIIKKEGANMAYLECSTKDNTKYLFREDTLVNFTAILDETEYTLPDVVTSVLLPKVVKFVEEPPLEDAISSSGTWRNNALVMTYGPMQLLGSSVEEFYVCWLRAPAIDFCIEGGRRNFKVALIPNFRWETEMVKLLKFHLPGNKYSFLERKFPVTIQSEFVEKKLYIVRPYLNLITCLNSKVVMKEDKQQVEAQPSSDVDGDCYAIPGPPIPDRRPITRQQSVPHRKPPPVPTEGTAKLRSDILRKIAERTKLGFGHVHKELVNIFAHDKQRPKLKKYHSTPTEDKHEKPGRLQKLRRSETDASKFKSKHRTEEAGLDYKGVHVSVNVSIGIQRPLPAIPAIDKEVKVSSVCDDADTVYDLPDSIHSSPTKNKSDYDKLMLEDEAVIMTPNQTIEDFCKYSVKQVAECFRLCAMEKFSNMCESSRIDGAFLAKFDLQELKNEPFFLTAFQVKKVKLIIHDGWRPIYDTFQRK